MNLFLALFVLLTSPKGPQVYYFNGKSLVKVSIIEMPNAGHADIRFFVNSPRELLAACIDSSEVGLCIPRSSQCKRLKLKGRWYTITWRASLKVGAERHVLLLTCYSGKTEKVHFVVEVEGEKKLNKPQGIDR